MRVLILARIHVNHSKSWVEDRDQMGDNVISCCGASCTYLWPLGGMGAMTCRICSFFSPFFNLLSPPIYISLRMQIKHGRVTIVGLCLNRKREEQSQGWIAGDESWQLCPWIGNLFLGYVGLSSFHVLPWQWDKQVMLIIYIHIYIYIYIDVSYSWIYMQAHKFRGNIGNFWTDIREYRRKNREGNSTNP